MQLHGEAMLVRIYIGESDHWHHKPLYQELVQAARGQGLAGATVLRGIERFGASSRIHTSRLLSLSEDLPLVIEIVDTTEKVEAFLAAVDELLTEGLVTMERVEVRAYRARPTGT
jgi:PII-like signaling protein